MSEGKAVKKAPVQIGKAIIDFVYKRVILGIFNFFKNIVLGFGRFFVNIGLAAKHHPKAFGKGLSSFLVPGLGQIPQQAVVQSRADHPHGLGFCFN
ncbi:MAG: hypothetical protein MZU97_05980 [Bacillus subtilis]|nr:hypothetical protein [Bacillus subtilis]